MTSRWVVAITVMLPTFMEIMDTSVVNVSLPHIQGSLNAGLDEVTWVLTSYLVSNAVIIPISGWLSGLFGRKRYLLFSVCLFVGSSILCGAATSLNVLIIARSLQGIGGGGLQPLSQAILLESFPQEEHGVAMAFFGMGVVMAPILGPVVGGWITDHWNWRWIFYINFPMGILAVILITFLIQDPPYIRQKRRHRIDRWGLLFLTVGLGSLQIVLDKGQRDDWFQSHFIVVMTIVAATSLMAFILVEFRTRNPVVNLRVFRHRSFTAGCVIMFSGFLGLFGTLILLPLYTQNLMGYTATLAGFVLGPGGFAAFLIMPLAGILMKKGVSPRILLAIGLSLMAWAMWLMSGFNLKAGFMVISIPRVVLGFGLGLFFVPLSAATFVNIEKEEMGNASGVFNLLRNLGGSFGVAVSATLLARRTQVHQTFLAEHATPFGRAFKEHTHQLNGWLGTHDTPLTFERGPLAIIYQEVQRQATMLAFNDCFWILAWFVALLLPLTLIFRKPEGKIDTDAVL
ncbi:MAG: DHA2 family efflux MFS transporter permease subunit [Deltaproteobacteria bacterium]|nr:DHA2 family efflux MFS transporter permease subunit [Deltaproteobacteria bacterium]